MSAWTPWPYAAKAIIQHQWYTNHVKVWVIFKYPMDQSAMPIANYWDCRVDGVSKMIVTSVWLDEWTIQHLAVDVLALPGEVTLEYKGPSDSLRTTWGKQWEPWGPIVSNRVPFLWEDILVIDTVNKRVGVNVPLPTVDLDVLGIVQAESLIAAKRIVSGTLTHSAVGPTDDLNVADVNTVFIDCSANNVTIGAFVGGVRGQHLSIVRLCATVNDATLEHNEGTANQNIFLHRGLDETLTGEYGGWSLKCNGTSWFDVSHAKHV